MTSTPSKITVQVLANLTKKTDLNRKPIDLAKFREKHGYRRERGIQPTRRHKPGEK